LTGGKRGGVRIERTYGSVGFVCHWRKVESFRLSESEAN